MDLLKQLGIVGAGLVLATSLNAQTTEDLEKKYNEELQNLKNQYEQMTEQYEQAYEAYTQRFETDDDVLEGDGKEPEPKAEPEFYEGDGLPNYLLDLNMKVDELHEKATLYESEAGLDLADAVHNGEELHTFDGIASYQIDLLSTPTSSNLANYAVLEALEGILTGQQYKQEGTINSTSIGMVDVEIYGIPIGNGVYKVEATFDDVDVEAWVHTDAIQALVDYSETKSERDFEMFKYEENKALQEYLE